MALRVYPASGVLDYVAKRVDAVSAATGRLGKLVRSSHRVALDEEADASIDGRFYVDATRVYSVQKSTSPTEIVRRLDGVVEVGYFVGGGRSNKLTVAQRATSDAQVIVDALHDTRNAYDHDETGIRMITCDRSDARRLRSGPRHEVWGIGFTAEWWSAIEVTP